jgi:hypothetical protein
MKLVKLILFILILFLSLFQPSDLLAADLCSPDVSVDRQSFNTSVTFDVSNQALPNGSTVRMTLDKNLSYTAGVQDNRATFSLGRIAPGEHTFVIIIRGQGLCTSPQGKDSILVVPDLGQGTRTSIPWMQGAGPTRLITCIQDPRGSFASKEECETDLRTKFPTATPAPTLPPPPCRQEGKTWVCNTALGEIKTDPASFIARVFGILLSLAGGIALLLIIFSGYRLMTSQGNPEKVQAAREQLTSAIVGLLFIIFSLAILTIIGVDILKLPGFTR